MVRVIEWENVLAASAQDRARRSKLGDMHASSLIAERDPYCRGVLLLGLSAPVERLAEGFREAVESTTCRGFAVGRTIFEKPSLAWLAGEIDDDTLIARARETFENLIRIWREAHKDAPAKAKKTILEECAA